MPAFHSTKLNGALPLVGSFLCNKDLAGSPNVHGSPSKWAQHCGFVNAKAAIIRAGVIENSDWESAVASPKFARPE
jgi:hypothetical protein